MPKMLQLLCLWLLLSGNCLAEENKTADLYAEIMRMDTRLFAAFNRQDLATIKKIFDLNIEFYHDLGGLSNYQQSIENTEKLFAKNSGLQRTLLVESMEVYPINNYGAIQTGKHRFCHKENGKDDCGTFQFVHIWKRVDNSWTLARVISYGH